MNIHFLESFGLWKYVYFDQSNIAIKVNILSFFFCMVF